LKLQGYPEDEYEVLSSIAEKIMVKA
jgi:hypothetical protein